MSRKVIRLIAFDWDGTLMDSAERIIACVRAAAIDLDLGAPDDAAIRNIIGLGLREAVSTLFPGSDDSEVERVGQRYRHHYLKQDKTPSQLFPGAREVIETLLEREYLLAVATGKGRAGLDQVLEETGMGQLFHTTRCADETFSKPNPEMLLQIMDELGMEGEETLMVGDTEYDIQMAYNARARALAACYGAHEPQRLKQLSPEGCLTDIRELIEWLEQ